MLNNKAQGISMNVIIIAAIALIVLIILVSIFSGRMGLFNRDLTEQTKNTCEQRGGICADSCQPGYVQSFGATCPNPGEICCIKVQE